MSITKLMIIFVILSVLLYACLGLTLKQAATHIDNNGGVEQLIERVWKGKDNG
jgi:hypothetical protein